MNNFIIEEIFLGGKAAASEDSEQERRIFRYVTKRRLDGLNTNHCITMLTVLQEKSYQKAAEILHYSRSTVKEHISALEEEFGVKLFETRGRAVLPTPAGQRVAVHARAIRDLYWQARQEADGGEKENALRILATETLGAYVLPPSIAAFMARCPGTALSVKLGAHSQFCEQLRQGTADVAFGFIDPAWRSIFLPEFQVVPFAKESIVFFCNPRHPLAGKGPIMLEDLREDTFLLANKDGIFRDYLYQVCCKSGVPMPRYRYIDSGTLLKKLVLGGSYLSMIGRSEIEEELRNGTLVELPWAEGPIMGDLVAVYPKGRENPSRSYFLSLLRQRFQRT